MRSSARRACMLVAAASALATPGMTVLAQWKSADPARRIELPRDHASHPDYKIEWWYYTGHLRATGGSRYGYQLTFFRVGVDPRPANPSRWAIRDLHLAHFAISDLDRRRHLTADRLNRDAVGWAGAQTDRYEVWNDDWRVSGQTGSHRLRADAGRFAVDLVLQEGKPPVLQGRQGYSRKGSSHGNASHYYSLTRMPTVGTIRLNGTELTVEGASWMDHEFGTSFLESSQRGWDWFAIQMDEGTDLMLYGLRLTDGSLDPRSSGVIVAPDGTATALLRTDFTMIPGERWRSSASGARYPVTWRLAVPARALSLDVLAAFPEQELRTERSTRVTYWEGAVLVRGTQRGQAVTGRGYLEMTGYADGALSEVLR